MNLKKDQPILLELDADCIVIDARSSKDKTDLALNIAHYVAVEKNIPVAIFSKDMPKDEVARQMICSAARVNHQNSVDGSVPRERWCDLMREMSVLGDAPIYIEESPNFTIPKIQNKAQQLNSNLKQKSNSRLGLVLIIK